MAAHANMERGAMAAHANMERGAMAAHANMERGAMWLLPAEIQYDVSVHMKNAEVRKLRRIKKKTA